MNTRKHESYQKIYVIHTSVRDNGSVHVSPTVESEFQQAVYVHAKVGSDTFIISLAFTDTYN